MSYSKPKNKKRKLSVSDLEITYFPNNLEIKKHISDTLKKTNNDLKKFVTSEVNNIRCNINNLSEELNSVKKELERNNMLLESFIINFNENSNVKFDMNTNSNTNKNIKNEDDLNIQSLYIS